MGKITVIIGLLLLVAAAPLATVEAADRKQVSHDVQDRAAEFACDCCQKCKAARRPVAPKEEVKQEVKPGKTNGCKGCCDRCGKVLPPDPAEIPPEIIQKEIPPEIKDKPVEPRR